MRGSCPLATELGTQTYILPLPPEILKGPQGKTVWKMQGTALAPLVALQIWPSPVSAQNEN